jgi:hypothetical protein
LVPLPEREANGYRAYGDVDVVALLKGELSDLRSRIESLESPARSLEELIGFSSAGIAEQAGLDPVRWYRPCIRGMRNAKRYIDLMEPAL